MRWAVCFLWHFPWGRPHFALRSTLPCGVRTFLPDPVRAGRDRGGHLFSFRPYPYYSEDQKNANPFARMPSERIPRSLLRVNASEYR